MFRSVLVDRQQCLAICSQRIRNRSAAVGVRFIVPHIRIRHAFAIRSEYIHGTFATCSFSVCYIFALQKYGFCGAKVWFLTCKKGVFELQKYGFCFLNVALLQFVRHAFVECPQHCCKLFATLSQFVCHAFAICSPHCCNPFATHSQFVRHVVAICLPRFRTS